MNILWQGNISFKIKLSDGRVISINPQKSVSADVVLFSSLEAQIKDINKGFVICRPGEYEIKHIFIKAQNLNKNQGSLVYEISAEDVNLLFFGQIKSLPKAESLDLSLNIDILIFPLGLKNITLEEVRDLKKELEPKIFIPYLPKGGDQEMIKNLLHSFDIKKIEPLPHLKIKSKNLGDQEQIIVLSPQT